MYIQSLVKFFSIFCMVLLVCIPIAIAESVVNPEVTKSSYYTSGVSVEDDFFEGEYTELAIIVKTYEPRPLTSRTVEKGNAPIYAHLAAISTVPGLGIPRIQTITIRETGTNVLSRIKYVKPVLYSWDDIGYIQMNLKRIAKETDVPDEIVANLTARIRYKSDILPGVIIGGTGSKTFTEADIIKGSGERGEITLDDLIANEKYLIMGGKGYLVPLKIGVSSANFALYSREGRVISQNIIVRYGKEAGPFLLVRGSVRQQDYVRLIVEKAEGFKAGKGTYEFTAFPAYYTYIATKKEFNAFPNNKNLENEFNKAKLDFLKVLFSEYGEVEWYEVYIKYKEAKIAMDEAYKNVQAVIDKAGDINYENWKTNFDSAKDRQRELDKKYYEAKLDLIESFPILYSLDKYKEYDKLSEELREARINLEGAERIKDGAQKRHSEAVEKYEEQRKLELGSYALFYFENYETLADELERTRKIYYAIIDKRGEISEKFIRSIRETKDFDEIEKEMNNFYSTLEEAKEDYDKAKRDLNELNNEYDRVFSNYDPFGSDALQLYHSEISESFSVYNLALDEYITARNKFDIAQEDFKVVSLAVSDIQEVLRQALEFFEGLDKKFKEGLAKYEKKVAKEEKISGVSKEETTSSVETGEVSKIIVNLMAGTQRGETEVNFKLHLPIDKRPIQLTPEQIKSQINWTAVLIKDLDKIIDKLENTINSFYIACFAMTAIVIVSQFFKGVGERRREAAEKAAEEKKLEGIKEEVGDGFKEAQKNIDRYNELEEKIKVKGGLNKLSTDEIVEYYDLVKDDPGYSTQKRNYEKSELKLNTLIMERFPELEAEGLEAKKAELFPELYTQKEVPAKFRDAGALHVLNDKDGKKIGSLVIKNGQIFKKGEPTIPLDNTILYDKDKQAYRINQETKQIEPYSSPYKNEKSKSGKTIYKDKVEGKNVYIVPASVGTNLPGQLGKDVTKYRRVHGDIYFVYYPGKRVVPHVVTGKEPNPQVDGSLPSYEKGTPQYIAFERGMGNVHYAQKSGIKSAQVFGKPFTISDAKSFFVSEAMQCDEVMSPTQCKMLFNACDPVVCPPSRCNLGGKLKGKVTSVQQSGLIGSVALCFPNIKEGIIVPFCLTGIRNSLKTIRGNLELYQRCLEKLLEGESVGICDQLRSVFICDIIWREFIGPIFDMAANSLLDKVRPGRGGGEYISGVKGPMERAKGVSSYFVQSYAQEMFAAYKGRVSAEIGTELCKVGIYGKVPAFGDIFADIVAGGDPVQYSAKFSEHVHSKVVGNSEYNVYYQIRAGSSKEPVNYVVTLQKCGPTQIHKFLVGRGVVKTNDIIDESVNMIGPSGCKEICMSVNADKRCVFGKVISTSWMLQEGADAINEKMLGREITEASACIPNYDAVLTAAVNRQCSIVSPGKNWERVGVCGIGEGRNKGDCWMEIDTADKEFKRSIEKRICRGVICTKNKFCVGEPVNVLEGGDVCCESVGDIVGDCKSKPFVKEIESELKKVKNEIGDGVVLLDKWFNGGLKESGEFGNRRMLSDDEAVQLRDLLDEKPFESYLYLSMTFLYNEDYENAEKAINMIELKGYEDELNKRLEHYNLGMGLIIDAKISLGDEKAKEFCSIYIKDMESKLESLGEEDKEKVTVVDKCEKFKEEKPEEAESAVVGLITGDSPIRKLESEDKLTIDGKVKIIDTVVRDFVNEKTIIIKYVGSDSTDTYSIDITIKQIPGFQKVERP